MPNTTPTDSLKGTFAANSKSDTAPLTTEKLASKYSITSGSKTKATQQQKIRNGKAREFDKPENRGPAFKVPAKTGK